MTPYSDNCSIKDGKFAENVSLSAIKSPWSLELFNIRRGENSVQVAQPSRAK